MTTIRVRLDFPLKSLTGETIARPGTYRVIALVETPDGAPFATIPVPFAGQDVYTFRLRKTDRLTVRN